MASKRVWMITERPVRKPKPELSDHEKQDLLARADKFVAEFYAPRISPPKPHEKNNYVTHLTTRWRTPYLSFIKHFNCPGRNAISPTFERPLARLGYLGEDNWSLWFQRHSGKWIEVGTGLTLDCSFDVMKKDPWFQLL